MADPFLAEIRIFPFNFAPSGWAFCDGQLMSISQNTALFSLLGTTYGGDGQTTFALPNLQGAAPLGTGWGMGLSDRQLGETGGANEVTLSSASIPGHNHPDLAWAGFQASNAAGTSTLPSSGNTWAVPERETPYATVTNGNMAPDAVKGVLHSNGSASHNNLPPYLTLYFCIALQGIYPQRS